MLLVHGFEGNPHAQWTSVEVRGKSLVFLNNTVERRSGSNAAWLIAGPVATARNFYFGFLVERLSTSLDVLCGVPGAQTRVDALAAGYAGTHADTSGTFSGIPRVKRLVVSTSRGCVSE